MTSLPDWLRDPDRRFFEWAAPVLEEFAHDHGVTVERWFKDVALWALHFRHPLGGVGQIVVGLVDGAGSVSGCWWRDDFTSETRYLAHPLTPLTAFETRDALVRALEAACESILSQSEDNLVPHQMPVGMWHRYFTEESFGEWERSLPKAKL